MGKGPAILLVNITVSRWWPLLLGPWLLAACQQPVQPVAPKVEPSAYDAFYVWPGVRPAERVKPKTLYLLDGEVRQEGAPEFIPLRMGLPRLPGKAVWLVVRTERLDWTEEVYATILADLQRWQASGNDVVGLQIDFDAATRGIEGYAGFLADLRRRLPPQWRLSVTGLLDWSAHGDPRALITLARIIDEVVVQTYQGKHTIPGYEKYFRQMVHFPIPFRVALVQGGAWQAPPGLERNSRFRGYVVFLLKPVR